MFSIKFYQIGFCLLNKIFIYNYKSLKNIFPFRELILKNVYTFIQYIPQFLIASE